jgi:Fic family protein
LTFFLEVTEQAARKAIGLIERLLSLQETYRSRLHTARRSALQLRLCELVFHRPVVSIPYAQNQLQVTYRTAQNCVEGLVEKQILEEVPNTSHPKFFRAKEILDAISG